MSRTATATLLVALLLAAAVPSARAAEEPLPLPISVEVQDPQHAAAEHSLRLLELAMIDEVRRSQCARETLTEASADAAAPRIVLRVVVTYLVQESSWAMGTGERAEAVQGSTMRDPVATPSVEVQGQTEIVLEPEALPLRTRRFSVRAGGGMSDRMVTEQMVRDDAIARVAAEARKALCGSRGKLVKQIERARKDKETTAAPR